MQGITGMTGFWCCCQRATVAPQDSVDYYWFGDSASPVLSAIIGSRWGTDEDSTTVNTTCWFGGLPLAQGQVLTSATLTAYAFSESFGHSGTTPPTAPVKEEPPGGSANNLFPGATARIRINAYDTDNAPQLQAPGFGIPFPLPRTTAFTDASFDSADDATGLNAAATVGTDWLIADVTTVIQEIVNRPGWASGNNIRLFLEDNGSDFFFDVGTGDSWGVNAWFGGFNNYTLDIT